MLIHATTVARDNKAVILTGTSGIGKSDVALRLIMEHGFTLVSDDQTELSLNGQGVLISNPPASIAGMMEVRHVGLLRLPYIGNVAVALYVELVEQGAVIERLPDTNTDSPPIKLLEYLVPRITLPSYAASTPAKIRAAMTFPATDA